MQNLSTIFAEIIPVKGDFTPLNIQSRLPLHTEGSSTTVGLPKVVAGGVA